MNKYISSLGIVLFPFSLSLPLPLIYTSITYCFLLAILISKIKFKEVLYKNTVIYLMGLFALTECFSSIFISRFDEFFFDSTKLPFLLTPIVFLNSPKLLEKFKQRFLLAFLIGVIFYILFAWSYVIYHYFFAPWSYLYQLSLTDGYLIYVLYIIYNNIIYIIYIKYKLYNIYNILYILYNLYNIYNIYLYVIFQIFLIYIIYIIYT